MNNSIIVLIIGIVFFNFQLCAQCEVKDPRLNKRYEGECIKGKAQGVGKAWGESDYYEGAFKAGKLHGYGVYTWGDGSVYKGDFKKGKMEGEGILIKKLINGDTETKKGFFTRDSYIGQYKEDYKIVSQQSIRGVTLRKGISDINEVRINVYANGKIITNGVSVRDKNNSIQENRNGIVLTNVQFPLNRVEVSINVDSLNYNVVFEIYNYGSWEVNISL